VNEWKAAWSTQRPHFGHGAIRARLCLARHRSTKRKNAMNDIVEEEKTIEVLLVEDNPGDVRLVREAFRNVNTSIRLHLASDGMEALAFLGQRGAHLQAPRPDLILLDLNLPKMNGRDVLAKIKAHSTLKTIPTIVLSSSEADSDVLISYQLQANCYLRKPTQWTAFDSIVKSINTFWLAKVKMPQQMQSV
jgi:chemotaxis family two-component system response regulator Rcp1